MCSSQFIILGYVYVLNACGCVQEQIERGREGEHVYMGGAGNMCENVYVLCYTGCVDSLHPRQREELWEAIYRYIVYRVSS